MSKVSVPALNYISGKSKTVEYPASGPTEAVLTNKPTQGFMQHMARYSPAMAAAMAAAPEGFALGAEAGSVFGPVGTAVGGAIGGIGAAAIGGYSAESARQVAAQGVAAAMPKKKYPMLNPTQLTIALNKAAKEQAINEATGQMLGGLGNAGARGLAGTAESKLPPLITKYVGVPEPLTKYVQKRGTQNVFTPQNLTAGAALENVGQATRDLASQRSSVGEAIGNSEDFILGSGGESREVPTQDIASNLENTMTRRGYIDPDTSDLARSKDVSLLKSMLKTLQRTGTREVSPAVPEEVSKVLDSAGRPIITKPASSAINIADGPLTLRKVVNAKRLIDSHLEFGATLNREISDPAAAVAKQTNNALRSRVRLEFGSGVSKLYDDFGAIADAQEKLAEFTGTKDLSSVQQRAVQALRGIMTKNPGEVENIVKVLGAGLPGGESQARTIFDSIAAEPFTKSGIGAPSSWTLKAASALGATGGNAAKTALRASEGLSAAAENKSAPFFINRWDQKIYTNASPKLKGAWNASMQALQDSRDEDNGQ